MDLISEHGAFGGTVGFYRHQSSANNCEMRFSVFVPRQSVQRKLPVVTYLAGLTCTEETFMIKAGAQRLSAEFGLILVAPDTSPRGEGVADDPEGAYDFGLGAGFYLNATEAPWSAHYHMYDYVTRELPELVGAAFPADMARQGIFGHSMGGHGALTLGLRNPHIYRSISAFAPICSTTRCPWGKKALSNYLGDAPMAWQDHDASLLAANVTEKPPHDILVDQGMSDQFLEQELHPHLLEDACNKNDIALTMRRHEGYDHGYYFIATFMADHLQHHARILKG